MLSKPSLPLLQIKPSPRNPVLIADIGGSTSRFALAGSTGGPARMVTLANDQVPSLEAAIERYLAQIDITPRAAVLAVAGPVDGDEVRLTNRTWHFRKPELAARFGFATVSVINDFEAVAWAVVRLTETDTQGLGGAASSARGVRVVVGPGTGLGVSAVVPVGNGWHVVASEGGHASFGPSSDDEEPVFARLRAECTSVSAETILSGPGLCRLYRAMHPGVTCRDSQEIVTRARAGDPAACATVEMFARLLGRFAGDVALTFKATGGVYVAGGVAGGLGPLLDCAAFRAAFEAHPPYQDLLAAIPTRLITCREPGLVGCAALVEQLIGADYSI